ncbi:zinc-dependent alcohol dehydrogenase family protein [bacterium]|nr:zinc-dependent alcohol dehydrogenase family protein [bacterium]
MKAMILNKTTALSENANPLMMEDVPQPQAGVKEILIRISVCGVCHTELDEVEGRTSPSRFPVIPGHQVIGRIVQKGKIASQFEIGDRVGVAWIFSACGKCVFCTGGLENLCDSFRATGRDANGGYAEYMAVEEQYAYKIPDIFSDAEAAPLLCAGAIGYRSLRLTGLENGQNLGLIGFGASAHIVIQLVKHQFPDSKVFVFARSEEERNFAIELGAVWAGDIMQSSPEMLNAVIDSTPAWKPAVEAMKNLQAGGRLVINAIRKEDADKDCLLQLDYARHLWMEKEIKSVANVTRSDVSEFLQLAAEIPVKPEVMEYPFEDANRALVEMKYKHTRGAKVLRMY